MRNTTQTRTLAELYMAQDHPGRAMAVVRKLLNETPDDESLLKLRARLEEALKNQATSPDTALDDKEHPYGDWTAEGPPRATGEAVGEGGVEAFSPSRRIEQSGGASIRDRAAELGSAVVDQFAGQMIETFSRLLERIRERRRR